MKIFGGASSKGLTGLPNFGVGGGQCSAPPPSDPSGSGITAKGCGHSGIILHVGQPCFDEFFMACVLGSRNKSWQRRLILDKFSNEYSQMRLKQILNDLDFNKLEFTKQFLILDHLTTYLEHLFIFKSLF